MIFSDWWTNNNSVSVAVVVEDDGVDVDENLILVRPLPLEVATSLFSTPEAAARGAVGMVNDDDDDNDEAAAAANAALLIDRERSRTSFDRRSPLAVATAAAVAAIPAEEDGDDME